jgi:hypothetical protein
MKRKSKSFVAVGAILGLLTGLIGTLWAFATAEEHSYSLAKIDIDNWRETFSETFENGLNVTPWGPSRWIAHTPWNGDFGDARFVDPRPGFPFRIVEGGLLIEARKNDRGEWESGLLSSFDSKKRGFMQALGYFEMRAKLPPGPGVWPAFWLAGGNYLGRSGEIDVLEFYGHAQSSYETSLHIWPSRKDDDINFHSIKSIPVPAHSLVQDFHTYGVSVDRDWIIFYLDRVEVRREPSRAEFQQPKGILLNLALGPGWPIDKTPNPSHMLVSYVKAFERR